MHAFTTSRRDEYSCRGRLQVRLQGCVRMLVFILFNYICISEICSDLSWVVYTLRSSASWWCHNPHFHLNTGTVCSLWPPWLKAFCKRIWRIEPLRNFFYVGCLICRTESYDIFLRIPLLLHSPKPLWSNPLIFMQRGQINQNHVRCEWTWHFNHVFFLFLRFQNPTSLKALDLDENKTMNKLLYFRWIGLLYFLWGMRQSKTKGTFPSHCWVFMWLSTFILHGIFYLN